MTIIPIIRRSIKRNPMAGQTSHTVCMGPMQAEFTVYAAHEPIQDIETVKMIKWFQEDGITVKAVYITYGDGIKAMMKRLKKMKLLDRTNYNMNQPHETIHHQPEPAYLFKYKKKVKVPCRICNVGIEYDKIEYVDYSDADGESGEMSECPHCGGNNSFQYRFESISEVDQKELP